jgi:CRISPR-associated endonuclease Csn1
MQRDVSGKILQKDEVRYVIRKELKAGELGFTTKEQLEKIVDPVVRRKVLEHVGDRSLKEAFAEVIWMNKEKGVRIRHVRIFVDRITDPLEVKQHEHAHLSSKEYKQHYFAENGGGANFKYAIYRTEEKGKITTDAQVFNLMAASKSRSLEGEFHVPTEMVKGKEGKEKRLPLYAVLNVGTRVLLIREDEEELHEMSAKDLVKRLYRVFKFRGDDCRLYLQHHIEARRDEELGDGDSKINFDVPNPRILISKTNLNFLVEGKHFDIAIDGIIKFK